MTCRHLLELVQKNIMWVGGLVGHLSCDASFEQKHNILRNMLHSQLSSQVSIGAMQQMLYCNEQDTMHGSLTTTSICPYGDDCQKSRPNYYLARTLSYKYRLNGGGWVTKCYYNQMMPGGEVCAENVSSQYETHEYNPPYNVATLQSIAICNLLYWLQQVCLHDVGSCRIKSPIFRVLQALTEIDLPESFKILHIVSPLSLSVHGRRTMRQHICFPGFVMNCRNFTGDSTRAFYEKLEDLHISEIENFSVKVDNICVRFGKKVLFPKLANCTMPIGLQFPYQNSSVESIAFGAEINPPVFSYRNLVTLYEYFKDNKNFKCCDLNATHVSSFSTLKYFS